MNCFKLIFTNHPDSRGVEDWVLTLMGMLLAAGKDVSIGDRFTPEGINIITECFDDEFVSEIQSAAKRGCKIIIIATEHITGNTFNNFHEPTFYERLLLDLTKFKLGRSVLKRTFRRLWRECLNRGCHSGFFSKRFHNFVKCAKTAQSIWVAERLQMSNYRQLLGPDQRIVEFPYCWFEPLNQTVNGRHANGQKTYDLFFSGTLTDYRAQVIRELETAGFSTIKLLPTTPLFFRNQFADASRIILDIKQNEDWCYISNLRVHYHLQRGDFIVSEKRKNACCLQPYLFQAGDSLFSSISQLLQEKNNLAQLGCENLERFRSERPASRLVPELLEHSGL